MAEVGCAGILVADTLCGPLLKLPDEGQLLVLDTLPAGPGVVILEKNGKSPDEFKEWPPGRL